MKRGVLKAAGPRSRSRLRRALPTPVAVNGEAALDPLTLRFRDRALEAAYRAGFYRHNLANLRIAHVFGVVMWVVWGLGIQGFLPFFDRPLDTFVRYGLLIPILLVGLAISFSRWYPRIWEWEITGAVLLSMIVWVFYVARLRTMPPDFGYVGLILITVLTYTLVRLRFLIVMLLTAVSIFVYLPVAVIADQIAGLKMMLAVFYLLSFGFLGGVAAYRLERFTRLLFVRERQLDRERHRSEGLLRNILPRAIAERLKTREESGPLAEGLEDVSVLFADAVGFTEQAATTTPQALVEALDRLFRGFDRLADRHGLEKIKTVGDAYMAVAGAPVPMAAHAEAAADMALAILEESEKVCWPSGDPVVMRIGVATGPAVAGVIGHRKFAYDLWGDTVNLASRLESSAEPGGILVSETLAERLEGRYGFGPPRVVDLKGKGPTPARALLGRTAERSRRDWSRIRV